MAVATPCWPAPVSAITRVLPILLSQQGLTEHVVDLVRTGVVQVFSLEEDARRAGVLAQSGGLVQRRRPAGVVRLQIVEGVEEILVDAFLFVGGGDLFDHRHQRLGERNGRRSTPK